MRAVARPIDWIAIVVGSDAVDEVQRLACRHPGSRRSGSRTAPCAQSARFFSILPNGFPRLSSAFRGLCKRLRRLAVVDHAAPQIDDLVDVFNKQRAFRLAGAAGGARPDFILGVNARRPGHRRLSALPNTG